MARPFVLVAFFLPALGLPMLAAGCAPTIGDGCGSATNCSVNGDRLCDLTQPGGACIVFDCQADGCPDNAVCVRFNPDAPRHTVVACMRRCGDDSNCRGEYHCSSAAELGVTPAGDDYASVLDVRQPDGRFCVAD
jgi:hypothetical protein